MNLFISQIKYSRGPRDPVPVNIYRISREVYRRLGDIFGPLKFRRTVLIRPDDADNIYGASSLILLADFLLGRAKIRGERKRLNKNV